MRASTGLFNDEQDYKNYLYICELNMCNSTQYFDSDLAMCSKQKNNFFIYRLKSFKKFCLTANRKKIDEPCNDTAFECNSNLVCVGTNGSKTCSYDINK